MILRCVAFCSLTMSDNESILSHMNLHITGLEAPEHSGKSNPHGGYQASKRGCYNDTILGLLFKSLLWRVMGLLVCALPI